MEKKKELSARKRIELERLAHCTGMEIARDFGREAIEYFAEEFTAVATVYAAALEEEKEMERRELRANPKPAPMEVVIR
jgi:hypothetical protein